MQSERKIQSLSIPAPCIEGVFLPLTGQGDHTGPARRPAGPSAAGPWCRDKLSPARPSSPGPHFHFSERKMTNLCQVDILIADDSAELTSMHHVSLEEKHFDTSYAPLLSTDINGKGIRNIESVVNKRKFRAERGTTSLGSCCEGVFPLCDLRHPLSVGWLLGSARNSYSHPDPPHQMCFLLPRQVLAEGQVVGASAWWRR